jgi:hypothetical protein
LLPLLVAQSLGYAHHAKYTFAFFLVFFVLVCEIRTETKRRSRKEKEKKTKIVLVFSCFFSTSLNSRKISLLSFLYSISF